MERRLSNANRWQATVKSRLGNAIRTVMTPVHMRSRTFLNQNVLHLASLRLHDDRWSASIADFISDGNGEVSGPHAALEHTTALTQFLP